jgi:archaellin
MGWIAWILVAGVLAGVLLTFWLGSQKPRGKRIK